MRATIASTPSVTSGSCSDTRGVSPKSTLPIIPIRSSLRYGATPVRHSNNTQPREKTSLLASTLLAARICSGDM